MCDPDGASEKTTGDIDNSVVERQRRQQRDLRRMQRKKPIESHLINSLAECPHNTWKQRSLDPNFSLAFRPDGWMDRSVAGGRNDTIDRHHILFLE